VQGADTAEIDLTETGRDDEDCIRVFQNWGKILLLVNTRTNLYIPYKVGNVLKSNTETLIDASKEAGLEINVEKTKYMLLSCQQNAG
jgi:hypothetical protein